MADDHGDEMKPSERMAMYRAYSGKWDSVTTTTIVDAEETSEFKGGWVQREILDGAMIEMKGYEHVDGETYNYLWLYGYDPREESYVGWFHDERGMHSKFYGNWSAKDKRMTWTLADLGETEIMVTIVDDLSDPDQLNFTFKLEGEDGNVIMTQEGSAKRAEKQ